MENPHSKSKKLAADQKEFQSGIPLKTSHLPLCSKTSNKNNTQFKEKVCTGLVKNRDIKCGGYHNYHCMTTYLNQWPNGNVSLASLHC